MPKPETDQMKVIHKALRREFGLLPALVAAVPDGDTGRARVVGRHLSLLLGMLHEHHESEDEFLWPLLHQRVPLEDTLIKTMETQHQTVDELITAIDIDRAAWVAAAGGDSRGALARSLARLKEALDEHLALEETDVLPLIHENLTVPEWLAPQRHAMANGPAGLSAKLLLAGTVLEDATPREQAWFLHEMPPPARILWWLIGSRLYANHTRAVRDVLSTSA
jgi:Hemerythrin HHE cation binding domain